MWDVDFFLNRAQELVKKAIDEHAEHNTVELDRSWPVKKGAATRRRLGEEVAVNTHTMGTSFVGRVRDVRIAEARIGGEWPTWWSSRLRQIGMKRPKRPAESKPDKVFQTGSSPKDSTRIDLSYSCWAFGGVISTIQSS